jgi:hypothetical protein
VLARHLSDERRRPGTVRLLVDGRDQSQLAQRRTQGVRSGDDPAIAASSLYGRSPPRASEQGVHDKAFKELLAEGRIVVDRIGSRRVKFYALPPSQRAGNQAEGSAEPEWR